MQIGQMVAEADRGVPVGRTPAEDVEQLVANIDRDGFTMIREVFDKDTVERARQDIEALLDGPYGPENLGLADQTVQLALPGKSRTFDAMLEHILTDPVTSGVLRACGGANLKMRDINARRMNGVVSLSDQFNPPLEWHRDGPHEFGIGILLTDVGEGDAPTGFIKGSHKYHSDPRWDAILGMPFYTHKPNKGPFQPGVKSLVRYNPFSRRLWHKELKKNVASATGKQGDIYVFLNQCWHSRMECRNGNKSVVVLCGCWPSEATFSAGIRIWPEELLASLPPTLAKCLRADAPPNPPTDTLLVRMVRERVPPKPFSNFWLACKEKHVMNRISDTLQAITPEHGFKSYIKAKIRA